MTLIKFATKKHSSNPTSFFHNFPNEMTAKILILLPFDDLKNFKLAYYYFAELVAEISDRKNLAAANKIIALVISHRTTALSVVNNDSLTFLKSIYCDVFPNIIRDLNLLNVTIKLVEQLNKEKISINFFDPESCGLIFFNLIASTHNYEAINYMLENGADCNKIDYYGTNGLQTMCHLSLLNQIPNIELLELAYEYKANFDNCDPSVITYLLYGNELNVEIHEKIILLIAELFHKKFISNIEKIMNVARNFLTEEESEDLDNLMRQPNHTQSVKISKPC